MKFGRLVAVSLVAAVTACDGGGGHEEPRLERDVLTPQAGSYENWGYAPDGGRLAYIRSDGRERQLWTSVPDGSEALQLFSAGGFWSVDWSPDGEKLAIIYKNNLLLIDPGNDLFQQLTADGQTIAFDWGP